VGGCPITDLGETVNDRECVVPKRDGTLIPVLKTAVRVTFGGREYILESFVDISKRKKAEAEIEHQAFHDGLTGLPNRTRFHEQLQESLAQARRDDQLLAVMFLDLDRFKTINDTLGHPVGDELLTRVAGRLSSCLRSHDSIARLGGDEFAVLVTGIDHPRGATGIAQRMVEALRAPFHINGFELHTTTSMGISLFPKDGTDAERLLQNADIALYHAKEQGRNTFRYYDSGVGVTAKERLTLETDLRHALEREQLVLHYQPQLHTPTGAIVGVESLLRWQHPDLGLLFPDKFIPLAEETGLIESIGEWVLQQACRQGKAWQEEGLHGLRVGVNLSPLQFHQPGLRHVITDTLHRTGFNPSGLELELTESAALRNLEASARIMGSLKSTGVRLCLDDFGVGYTSLVHLRQFPLDSVKIDRTFLRALEESPHDSAIISAILGIARSLGLGVIAEGVETVAQQHFLQQHGCEVMQGYLFSKPLPVAAATALLRARLVQSTAGLHV
jgi:diguanylate cyclase (GGDEF)-like protein